MNSYLHLYFAPLRKSSRIKSIAADELPVRQRL
jgi:hypothetical protein